MEFENHMTDPGTELARLAARTPPGMAYFVATGPQGKTCGGCKFFMGRPRKMGIGKGDMQPGRCREFKRMMRSKGMVKCRSITYRPIRLPADTSRPSLRKRNKRLREPQ